MFGDPVGEQGGDPGRGAADAGQGVVIVDNDRRGAGRVRRGPSLVGEEQVLRSDQRGRREAVKPVEQDLAVRCAPKEPAGFIPRRPSPRTRSSLAPGVHLISKPRTPPGDSAGAYLN